MSRLELRVSQIETKIPPVVVFGLVAFLMWGAARVVPAWRLPGAGSALWLVLAALVAALGLLFALLGVVAFGKAKTTVNPHAPQNASSLVTGGVYRFTRNPMYLGLLLILIAFALRLGNLLSVLLVALFVLYMNRFQIRPEERWMREKFGKTYREYAGRVRRWI